MKSENNIEGGFGVGSGAWSGLVCFFLKIWSGD